jgi:hypothetical protein
MDDKNVTVKLIWKGFAVEDTTMLVGEVWAAVTCSCMNRVGKKVALIWCLIVEALL